MSAKSIDIKWNQKNAQLTKEEGKKEEK